MARGCAHRRLCGTGAGADQEIQHILAENLKGVDDADLARRWRGAGP